MSRRLFAAPAVIVLSLSLASCSSGRPGTLSASAAKSLEHSVQQLREIAATGDTERLQAAITNFDAAVERDRKAGLVSQDRANAIEDAADALLPLVQPSSSPTESSTTTTTAQSSPSPSPSPTPSQSPTPSTSPTASTSQSPTPGVTVTISPP
jgi:hypothetical protein